MKLNEMTLFYAYDYLRVQIPEINIMWLYDDPHEVSPGACFHAAWKWLTIEKERRDKYLGNLRCVPEGGRIPEINVYLADPDVKHGRWFAGLWKMEKDRPAEHRTLEFSTEHHAMIACCLWMAGKEIP